MDETQKNKTLVIRNDIEELNRLVLFLEGLEEEWMLPPGLAPSINLALEEALSNVIFYAFEKGSENEISIDFSLNGKEMTIVVSDEGKPYDPLQKEDPDIMLSAEERPIGGLGIFLIKQIMDEVSYRRASNKNQLTMIKRWGAS
ncbi:MAG: ATP-binding protein [Prolixibacteraceae bacterium]|jgi:anti-sigma regulatory factor (Ser/Thr protein kinase)|nr:ATP-binding protein [Prolixibacteraceae bacterium]